MGFSLIKFFAIVIFIVWLFYAFYYFRLNKDYTTENSREFEFAKHQLKILQQQNRDLVTMMQIWRKKNSDKTGNDDHHLANNFLEHPSISGPGIDPAKNKEFELGKHFLADSEVHRRRAQQTLWHLSKYVDAHFPNLIAHPEAGPGLKLSLRHAENYTRDAILDASSHLRVMKSLADRHWKSRLNAKLSKLVAKRISHNQNPSNCSAARKLVCDMGKACGFGCQIHHTVYCFIVAYATRRVLVVRSSSWTYDPQGFEHNFLPISKTCKDDDGQSRDSWGGDEAALQVEPQVLSLPIVDVMQPKSSFLPSAVPGDLAPLIALFHGRPHVWWVGQFVNYLLRPQPQLKAKIRKLVDSRQIPFARPIVGVHVRRTDKIDTEASRHEIDEYMKHVEDWFRLYETSALYQASSHSLGAKDKFAVRRIYLATDEATLLAETRKKYPHYEVLGNQDAANSAGTSSRYSPGGLTGIYLDVYFLSRCDHLVCTFSSQVCRLAFELMNGHDLADPSDSFYSLDDMYYYGGGQGLDYRAVRSHGVMGRGAVSDPVEPIEPYEMGLDLGDIVGLAGDENNGFSAGKRIIDSETGRGNKKDMFPSYLLQELPRAVSSFSNYSEIQPDPNDAADKYSEEVSTNPIVDSYDVEI